MNPSAEAQCGTLDSSPGMPAPYQQFTVKVDLQGRLTVITPQLKSVVPSIGAGVLHLQALSATSGAANYSIALLLALRNFVLPDGPVFPQHQKALPATCAAAFGYGLKVPILNGSLVLGADLEVSVVSFGAGPPEGQVRSVELLATVKVAEVGDAVVDNASLSVPVGASLFEGEIGQLVQRQKREAASAASSGETTGDGGGIISVTSLDPSVCWTSNENWDPTVRADMLAYLSYATGKNSALSSAIVGREVSTAFSRGGGLELGSWQGLWGINLASKPHKKSRMAIMTTFTSTDKKRQNLHSFKHKLRFPTKSHSFTDIRESVGVSTFASWFRPVKVGLAHFFIRHTSATVMLAPVEDLRNSMKEIRRLVPERLPFYRHTYEGDDDMPAHIKTTLFGPYLVLPIRDGALVVSSGQVVALGEFRANRGQRTLTVVVEGVPM